MLQVAQNPVSRRILQQVLPQVVPLAFQAGKYMMDTVASKIAERKSQPNMPQSRRPRKTRPSRAKRRGRAGAGIVTERVRAPPVRLGVQLKFKDQNVQFTSIRDPVHGSGIRCNFASILCTIGSNNVALNSDFQLPILKSSFHNVSAAQGFISLDTNWVSGMKVHPRYLGHRMEEISTLYQRYQPRSLTFRYQPFVGSNNNGQVVMAFSYDPVQFIESSGTWGTLIPQITNLSQTSPCTSNPLWDTSELNASRFDKGKTFYIADQKQGGNTSSNSSFGDLAFEREIYCGRLGLLLEGSVAATSFGRLWCEGTIDFYNASVQSALIAETTPSGAQLLDEKSTVPVGLFNAGHQAWVHPKTGAMRRYDQKHILSKSTDSKRSFVDALKLGKPLEVLPPPPERDGWVTISVPRSSLKDYPLKSETPGDPLIAECEEDS